jgi:DNA-binding transcriptional MerR regulator
MPDSHRPQQSFTIRELCDEFDVTPRTLRFYEDKGLVAPKRVGQGRVYSRRDRARLTLALRTKRFGLTLAEIGEMLDLYDPADGGTAQNAYLLARCRQQAAVLRAQRSDIDQAMEQLERLCGWLEAQLAQARAGEPGDASPRTPADAVDEAQA